MATVTVQVPIRKGWGGNSYLLETKYEMDFLPAVGEMIYPCKFDKDSGLTFEINSRYWDEDGKTVLLIGRHIIDPDLTGRDIPRGWHAWWTDRDGDLIDILLANGWMHYKTASVR